MLKEVMSTPKISIIIPIYNGGIYKHEGDLLTACLDSALNQTLRDIEVICAYRASEGDEAIEILKQYALRDTRLKILYQTTKGMAAARNEALREAIGEYIAFLDSDDFYYDNDALERLYYASKRHKVDICGGFMRKAIMYGNDLIDTKDDPFFHSLCETYPEGRCFSYIDYQFDYKFYCYIYNREMLINGGIFFPENLIAGEDPIFHTQAMFLSEKFCIVPTYFYCWRVGHQVRARGGIERDMSAINRHTRDDIKSRIINLKFSKEHRLHILHWINAQRICSQNLDDYLELYRYNDIETLELFLEANSLLDEELIDQAQLHLPSDDILIPMELKENYKILEKVSYNNDKIGYVLSPLRTMFFSTIYYADEMRETNGIGYRKEVEVIKESKSYKIGRCITWLPRKVRGGYRCLLDNGWKYTIRHTLEKVRCKLT